MLIKCKMCGGDLEFQPGATYGTCEYCGSTSTIPQADDEGKLNRYNRANHFRRQCEFDKAVTAYEKLLEQDDTDAEAHWGAVISRYGIEYVEDPATKKRIPTCHRVQVASILADADYLAAVEHAPDAASRDLYKQQAAEIAEIQKGILAISANEKPYDVFICYKETDEQGQRTRDSQWAQDVYYGLTEQGYKVFFSRITLEDKLGQQYEPYIFAALNSAKVMVVIGSKPEYFNAVWVKNEWSRYLALMAKDRKRLLIPCYRGMDPYDLPEELSSLQSQDMSKIGFMQDLLRGIKKVLDADKKPEQVKVGHRATQTASSAYDVSPTISNLLKRAALFLEDGDFKQANEYLDRILDLDVECAPAYVAKVCVAFGLRREAALADTTFLYDDNADWQKALRFANAQQKAIYEGYYAKAKARVDVQIRNYAYDCAMEMAVNPLAERSELDDELASYKATCTRSGDNRANGSRRQNSELNEKTFRQAVRANNPGNVGEQSLKAAAAMFDIIKDGEAAECSKQCWALAEQARHEAEVAAKKKKGITIIGIAASLLIVLGFFVVTQIIIPGNQYNDAVKLMADGKYQEASSAFIALRGYKDASERVYEPFYVQGKALMDEGDYEAAIAAFKKANGFSDASAQITACETAISDHAYDAAVALMNEGKYNEAITAFGKLNGYRDSATKITACRTAISDRDYDAAMALMNEGKYDEAIAAFRQLGEHRDSAMQLKEARYRQAGALNASGKYTEAYALYTSISGYKDVDSLLVNDHNLAAVETRKPFTVVGNIVTYGNYEQDNNPVNGKEPIEWIVLKYDSTSGKTLLLSRYGLDSHRFDESKYQGWDKSEIRNWLNSTFINDAFTAKEQEGIVTTYISTPKNGSISGGRDVSDKIWLLSREEVKSFPMLQTDNVRKAVPTKYAVAQGRYQNKIKNGTESWWWWLRSPDSSDSNVSDVSSGGSFSFSSVSSSAGSVRPAFWLNLDAADIH